MTTARSSRVANDAAIAIALMTAAAVATTLSAHRLDEYLQAARLAVEPSQVQLELDLTPGIAVAGTVLADIDRDGDGLLSAEEQRAYAATVLSAIDLAIDRQPLRLQLVALTFPVSGAMKRGEGTIRLQWEAALPSQSLGAHSIVFRNGHRQDIGVYLANAMTPSSDRVAIGAQRRDRDQRELTIDYVVRSGPALRIAIWLLVSLAGTAMLMKRRGKPAPVLPSS